MLGILAKSVGLVSDLAVLDPMMVVPQKLLYVQNMDTANAALTLQEDQLVDLALEIQKELETQLLAILNRYVELV